MDEELQGLLAYIYGHETGLNPLAEPIPSDSSIPEKGGFNPAIYDVVSGFIPRDLRPPKPLSTMTVAEVMEWQRSISGSVKSTAAGAVQVISGTLRSAVAEGIVSPEDTFNGETQNRLTIGLMRRRGLDDWQAGKISPEQFGTNLAKEWASLPVLVDTYNGNKPRPRGSGFYGGDGLNPSNLNARVASFSAVLGDPGNMTLSASDRRPRGGTPSVGGGTLRRGGSSRYSRQNAPRGITTTVPGPWDTPDVSLRMGNRDLLPGVPPAYQGFQGSPTGYSRANFGGGGPVAPGGFWSAFSDEWTDDAIVRGVQRARDAQGYEWDRDFDPMARAFEEGLGGQWRFFADARNGEHYDFLKGRLAAEGRRHQRRGAYDGWFASMAGAMTSPTGLMSLAVPGGVAVSAARRGGTNALRSGVSASALGGGTEGIFESMRAPLDPLSTGEDSLVRVGGAAVLSGVLGAALGGVLTPVARRGLEDRLTADIALARGVGTRTQKVRIDGTEFPVERAPAGVAEQAPAVLRGRGVAVIGGKVFIDEATIQARFEGMEKAPGGRMARGTGQLFRSADELAEFEVGFAAALARPGTAARRFARDESGQVGKLSPVAARGPDGELVVNRAELKRRIDRAEPIELGPVEGDLQAPRIKPISVDGRAFKNADEAEEIVRAAQRLGNKARDQGEFREMLSDEFYRRGKPRELLDVHQNVDESPEAVFEAEQKATEALEKWRRANNKIIENARIEAIARVQDGPYKRVHRNALAPETRDLVALVAHDGGFLRGLDGSGLSPGPSVYSRAKTWNGIVRHLADRETELYEKYLGFAENPEIAGIAVNKSFRNRRAGGERAMPLPEWRRSVSVALITGRKSDHAEINEMAQELRAAWNEYKAVAEDFGVISSKRGLKKQEEGLQERIDALLEKTQGEITPNIETLQRMQEMVRMHRKMAELEPDEDYFTRVYSHHAVRENRDAFKHQVVIPWMRANPWVDVFEEGSDILGQQISMLRASKIDINQPRYQKLRSDYANALREERTAGRWTRVATSSDPNHLSKRADELIDQILGEAEPEDLLVLREPHRPTFGRHRQFTIPNRLLLKEENGIADFIETDYLMLHKVYAERMGPAIEMARSFARPLDGLNWADGFLRSVAEAREAERRAFEKAGNKGDFFDHWEPIERDLLHLRDRVTNRVVRSPERWDNRAAAVLRDWSHLAFMGMAALPAVQDLGVLVMRHGVKRVWGSAMADLDEATRAAFRNNIQEAKAAGAILDVQLGAALANFAETGFDPVHVSKGEKWLRQGANKYFVWNGLASITARMKELDATIRVHDLVQRIDNVGMGVGSAEDFVELDRWGISKADAEKMARQPIFRTEEGHWQANTPAWDSEDLVRKFRAAVLQGSENTVLLATAADKPTIVDGVVFLRRGKNATVDRLAVKHGLELHGDFWRVQSGLMTLPFTFWNYALAATNKIMLSGLSEPSARAMGGMATLLGLGAMVSATRDTEFAWNRRTADEKIGRAVDQSAVLGALPMYFQVLQNAGAAANGDMFAAIQMLGAGPSVLRNAVEGVAGDVDSGSWALPFRNHFLLKGIFDAMVDGIERTRAGVDAAA